MGGKCDWGEVNTGLQLYVNVLYLLLSDEYMYTQLYYSLIFLVYLKYFRVNQGRYESSDWKSSACTKHVNNSVSTPTHIIME